MRDIVTEAFILLRNKFFDSAGKPIVFQLRPKRNTQDDPFDELLAQELDAGLKEIKCVKAPGPLTTPDLVLFRPNLCHGSTASQLQDDIDRIVGVEVKKLERTARGDVARASGLDYNTTPPCGTIRLYDARYKEVKIRCFYIFTCVETSKPGGTDQLISALALADGNLLNRDYDLYIRTVGERQKRIELGSYGNGADRTRPMLIFGNPLGIPELDGKVTLVHPVSGLDKQDSALGLAYTIERSLADNGTTVHYCYRLAADMPDNWQVGHLKDPFRTPIREQRTRPRGKFVLPFTLSSSS
jgi:hypothetical protein